MLFHLSTTNPYLPYVAEYGHLRGDAQVEAVLRHAQAWEVQRAAQQRQDAAVAAQVAYAAARAAALEAMGA